MDPWKEKLESWFKDRNIRAEDLGDDVYAAWVSFDQSNPNDPGFELYFLPWTHGEIPYVRMLIAPLVERSDGKAEYPPGVINLALRLNNDNPIARFILDPEGGDLGLAVDLERTGCTSEELNRALYALGTTATDTVEDMRRAAMQ